MGKEERLSKLRSIDILKSQINKGYSVKSLVPVLGRSYKAIHKKLWELKKNKVSCLKPY